MHKKLYSNGWFKFPKGIEQWQWFGKPNTLSVYICLYVNSNYEDSYLENHLIKRGETSLAISSISRKTSLTVDQVRTALKHLLSTEDVTKRRAGNFTVYSITNYDNEGECPEASPEHVPEHVPEIVPQGIPTDVPTDVPTSKIIKKERNKEYSLQQAAGQNPSDDQVEQNSERPEDNPITWQGESTPKLYVTKKSQCDLLKRYRHLAQDKDEMVAVIKQADAQLLLEIQTLEDEGKTKRAQGLKNNPYPRFHKYLQAVNESVRKREADKEAKREAGRYAI